MDAFSAEVEKYNAEIKKLSDIRKKLTKSN